MTDNFHEFEHTETEPHDTIPPAPVGFSANLKGAWRTQPLFKLFVLMVAVGAVVAVAVSLFAGGPGKSSAILSKVPEMHEAPGGKSSPYLKEQTEMANNQRTQEAMQNGGSALPTPIGPNTDNGDLSPNTPKEDPLNELRAEVADMNKQLQEAKQTQTAPPPQQAAPEPFDDSLAQAMQRQMTQLLDSWAPKASRTVMVADLDAIKIEREEAEKASKAATAASTAAANAPPAAKIVIPAGTVSYAQLLTEANSDVPGPILGQLVSGPLKGARLVGQFQVTNAYRDYLTLTFTVADLKGVDYSINAIALDPDTTLGGMATEVDQRYFERLILPAAAGFLQGFAGAIGQGNSTLTTNGTSTIIQQSGEGFHQGEYAGLSTAAQTAAQFFQNQANNTLPLVRVASGTPMGIFFINSVTDQTVQQMQASAQAACNNPNLLPGTPLAVSCFGPNAGGLAYGANVQNPYALLGQNPYGALGQAAAAPNVPYPQANGNTAAGSGYPVLYPNANAAATGSVKPYSSFIPAATGAPAYPGSTVYYTH